MLQFYVDNRRPTDCQLLFYVAGISCLFSLGSHDAKQQCGHCSSRHQPLYDDITRYDSWEIRRNDQLIGHSSLFYRLTVSSVADVSWRRGSMRNSLRDVFMSVLPVQVINPDTMRTL